MRFFIGNTIKAENLVVWGLRILNYSDIFKVPTLRYILPYLIPYRTKRFQSLLVRRSRLAAGRVGPGFSISLVHSRSHPHCAIFWVTSEYHNMPHHGDYYYYLHRYRTTNRPSSSAILAQGEAFPCIPRGQGLPTIC